MTHITSSISELWQDLFRYMNRPPYTDLLRRLETQLRHFDGSPDFGDAEVVAAIRRHLLLRIGETKSLMAKAERLSQSEAA